MVVFLCFKHRREGIELKEIWKRILAGVNLGNKHRPKNESTCSCVNCGKEDSYDSGYDDEFYIDPEPAPETTSTVEDDTPEDDDEKWRYVPRGLS